MEVKNYDGTEIRRVVSAMITDRAVCSRIASQWTREGLFDSRWANLVGGWCVHHLRKYGDCPDGQISTIFQNWAEETIEGQSMIDSVEDFLQYLSDDYKVAPPVTSEYMLDLAGLALNKIRLKKELDAAQTELENNQLDECRDRLRRIRSVELGIGSFIHPAEEPEAFMKPFETNRRKPLITYPSALGRFLDGAFVRGEFYSIMSPDKTGKTTWLIDLTYRAIRRRNRVAFFDVGDGSVNEVMAMLALRSGGQPEASGTYKYPDGWDKDGKLITIRKKSDGVDPIDAHRKFKKICKSLDAFRLSHYANSTISVEGLDGILSDWEREDWRPDVIVIDYADILAPPKGMQEGLEQIDETWKQLRRMSQRRHCLVLTATQSSAAAYGKQKVLMGKQHFSGRKTKLAHVNGILGINVTDDERSEHMARVNWVVRRRVRKSSRKKCVTVAGCFDICNPVIKSK